MKLPIVMRAEAEAEFDHSFDWYDRQRPGLGSEFLHAVQNVFDGIASTPLMHQAVLADIRKAVVRRFPYSIFYRPHADCIEILAVFNSNRDPSEWQKRI